MYWCVFVFCFFFVLCCFFFVFFQAEDGIRDLVRSRGLGDVYKRQVLVFAVTRVIFIPQGEFVAFGALTLALLQTGRVPGTVWFLLALTAAAVASDLWSGWRQSRRLARTALRLSLIHISEPTRPY